MTQRITTNYQNQVFVAQLFDQQKDLSELRQKIASGFEISRPSDDPGRAGTIAELQTLLARIDSHKQRIGYAENILTQQETAITNAKDVMTRAKEIASQASNEVYSVGQRKQLATEVWALRDAIVAGANTKVLGKYIYGGTDDDDPPMDLSGVNYTNPTGATVNANKRYIMDTDAGWDGIKSVDITDDETIRLTPGSPNVSYFWQGAVNALERLGRTLEGYRTTPEVSLANPDLGGVAFTFPAEFHDQTSAIQNSLDQIQGSIDAMTVEQSDLGGRMNRLDQAKSLLVAVQEVSEQNRSDLQDGDIFDLSSQLANLQTSFQALLATGSQINRLSLLDYF